MCRGGGAISIPLAHDCSQKKTGKSQLESGAYSSVKFGNSRSREVITYKGATTGVGIKLGTEKLAGERKKEEADGC